MITDQEIIDSQGCPHCDRSAGQPCKMPSGHALKYPHQARIVEFYVLRFWNKKIAGDPNIYAA